MITTRADLDALEGTDEHDAFLAMLAGSLFRTEYDATAKRWVVIEDDTLISQFGFVKADFSNISAPDVSMIDIPKPEQMTILQFPSEISDRQFFQQLAIMGLISEDEAISAVSTGALPPVMAGFIDQLPANQRFAARMALQGATTFIRSNPLVETFGSMQGMTSSEIDDLWRAASLL